MRSFTAHRFGFAILVLAAGAILFLPLRAVTRAQEDGRAAYAETCARCHSVVAQEIEATVSERMRGPDLGEVGTDHEADWVVAVVKQETELDGGPHRPRFGGTDDQLRALASWLVGLD